MAEVEPSCHQISKLFKIIKLWNILGPKVFHLPGLMTIGSVDCNPTEISQDSTATADEIQYKFRLQHKSRYSMGRHISSSTRKFAWWLQGAKGIRPQPIQAGACQKNNNIFILIDLVQSCKTTTQVTYPTRNWHVETDNLGMQFHI